MARYTEDGLRIPTSIWEAAIWHYAVEVRCSNCDHSARFEAVGLWWYFERRGWEQHFSLAARHFYCRRCREPGVKNKPRRLEAVMAAGERRFSLPDDRTWKRALSRFRG